MIKGKLKIILALVAGLAALTQMYYFNSIQIPKNFKVIQGINTYRMGWGEAFTSSVPMIYKGKIYMQLHDINKLAMLDCEYDVDMNIIRIKNVQMEYGYRVHKQIRCYFIMNEEVGREIKAKMKSDIKVGDVKVISELNSTFIKNVEEELDLMVLTTNNGVYLPIREVCDLVNVETSWNRFQNELEVFVDEPETIPQKGVIRIDTN